MVDSALPIVCIVVSIAFAVWSLRDSRQMQRSIFDKTIDVIQESRATEKSLFEEVLRSSKQTEQKMIDALGAASVANARELARIVEAYTGGPPTVEQNMQQGDAQVLDDLEDPPTGPLGETLGFDLSALVTQDGRINLTRNTVDEKNAGSDMINALGSELVG